MASSYKTVHYIILTHYIYKCVYNDDSLMKPVRTIRRYIDDGAGFFYSTEKKFTETYTMNYTLNG